MKKEEPNYKKYHLIKLIGKGCYSQVYKAKSIKDNLIYSIKIIEFSKMSEKNKKRTLNEIRILNSISHPNILKFEEAFTHPKKEELWIVSEFLELGDLADYIKNKKKQQKQLPKKKIWQIAIQILLGLAELNKLKIIHRDIKPANIFLNKKLNLKIGDFNISKINEKGEFSQTQIGTPYYLAPEIWQKQPYNEKCDIFSFGIILFELTFLKHPFLSESKFELKDKILHKKIKLPNTNIGYIISKCLTVNPLIRPNAESLLSHFIIKSRISKYGLEVLMINHKSSLNCYLKPKIELTDFKTLNKSLPNDKTLKSIALTFRKRINSTNVEEGGSLIKCLNLRKSLNSFQNKEKTLSELDNETSSIYGKISHRSEIDPLGIKLTNFSRIFNDPEKSGQQKKATTKLISSENSNFDYCSLYDNKENNNKQINHQSTLPIKEVSNRNENLQIKRKHSFTYSNIIQKNLIKKPQREHQI